MYSDADIVLSAEWVPPVCLARGEPPLSAPPHSDAERARKTQAVSFSLDNAASKDDAKPDKKNKVFDINFISDLQLRLKIIDDVEN